MPDEQVRQQLETIIKLLESQLFLAQLARMGNGCHQLSTGPLRDAWLTASALAAALGGRPIHFGRLPW